MVDAFKNNFNKKMILNMASSLKKSWAKFDSSGFISYATKNIENLELKERSRQITDALHEFLPSDFKKSSKIILQSLNNKDNGDVNKRSICAEEITGWDIMPIADYVGIYGLKDFDASMNLFKEMTKSFTSEFGIRFFIIEEPKRTLDVLKTWVNHPNKHVRRLISEGTRPRLPWAMQLPIFIKDPKPIIKLLEKLKDDNEEYVRRSVANNLNDISKDHPELIIKLSKEWLKGDDINRNKLIKHGCRTLIKQGNKGILKILGYKTPHLKTKELKIINKKLKFGGSLKFNLKIESISNKKQKLIIDYAIHHLKANGKHKPKIFKWKNIELNSLSKLNIEKKHAIKKITTRKYYAGKHKLEIFINGVSFGCKSFELII